MGTPSAKLVVRKPLHINVLIFSLVFSRMPCPNGVVELNGDNPAKSFHFLFLHLELGFLTRSLTGECSKNLNIRNSFQTLFSWLGEPEGTELQPHALCGGCHGNNGNNGFGGNPGWPGFPTLGTLQPGTCD